MVDESSSSQRLPLQTRYLSSPVRSTALHTWDPAECQPHEIRKSRLSGILKSKWGATEFPYDIGHRYSLSYADKYLGDER